MFSSNAAIGNSLILGPVEERTRKISGAVTQKEPDIHDHFLGVAWLS
jgi:hypothetical protein